MELTRLSDANARYFVYGLDLREGMAVITIRGLKESNMTQKTGAQLRIELTGKLRKDLEEEAAKYVDIDMAISILMSYLEDPGSRALILNYMETVNTKGTTLEGDSIRRSLANLERELLELQGEL